MQGMEWKTPNEGKRCEKTGDNHHSVTETQTLFSTNLRNLNLWKKFEAQDNVRELTFSQVLFNAG